MDNIYALEQLVVYHNLSAKPGIKLYLKLRKALQKKDVKPDKMLKLYSSLVNYLWHWSTPETVGDLWQNYLAEQILGGTDFAVLPEVSFLEQELKVLQQYWQFDLAKIEAEIAEIVNSALPFSYCRLNKQPEVLYSPSYEEELKKIKLDLMRVQDWTELASRVLDFYHQIGTDIFAKYWGFTWHAGQLEGIKKLETVELDHFVGYDEQRKQLLENTAQFIKGFGANNVLLYGDRGTGKSSSIKALFTCFSRQGLRIIELAKHQLVDFPELIRLLKDKKERFIIFIDDLSFEPEETDYKYMKAILEGGLEVQPKNILVYATSNRRHLVREFRHEREMNEELNKRDIMQEKLSLADRFGLTITFSSPSEKEYLQIVEKLAERRGIELPTNDLHRLALQWQMWHNGLSGRTAKQFVEDLAGKMEL